MSKLSELFVKRAREELEKRNWTQSDLALKVGLHVQSVHRYLSENEAKRVVPGLDALESIAKAFGISPSELIAERETATHSIEECYRRVGAALFSPQKSKKTVTLEEAILVLQEAIARHDLPSQVKKSLMESLFESSKK